MPGAQPGPDDDECRERQLHPEHEPPAAEIGEQSTDDRTDDRAECAGGEVDADGPRATLGREGRDHDRERDGVEDPAGDPLPDPGGDQQFEGRGRGARRGEQQECERAAGEDDA